MNKKNKLPIITIAIVTSLLFFLGGCSKYRWQQFKKKHQTIAHYQTKTSKYALELTTLKDSDKKDFLKNYEIIHLTIQNTSPSPLQLDGKDIRLPLSNVRELKKKEPRFFIYNFLPSFITAALGLFFWWQIIIPSVIGLGAIGCQKSFMEHEKTCKQIKKHIIEPTTQLTIKPYTSKHAVMFVRKKDYTPHFSLILKNKKQQPITVPITITARSTHAFYIH